jgi:hypothetical protein
MHRGGEVMLLFSDISAGPCRQRKASAHKGFLRRAGKARDSVAWALLWKGVPPCSLSLLLKLFCRVPVGACRVALAMRFIFGILCLLLGLGMLSCRVEGPVPRLSADATAQGSGWVRTSDGWERPDSWNVPSVGPPQLHPWVVAAGQGLVSLLGLAACQRDP